MPTCLHHVQWVRRVPGGLHQCIQCFQVVAKKDVYPKYEDQDVYPKYEDLSDEFRRRWEDHEATRPSPPTPAAEPSRG